MNTEYDYLDLLVKRISYLEAKQKEYDRLIEMISYQVEKDPFSDEIKITITKNHQLNGRHWQEIVAMAMGLK